jgi:hypothetical protein
MTNTTPMAVNPDFVHCGEPDIVDRLHEIDHMRGLVIPGRHLKVASPESMALGHRLCIPGSRAKARAPE